MTMLNGYHIKTLFFFFFKIGIRARRAKLFFLFSLIPVIIIVIVRLVMMLNPDAGTGISNYFTEIGASFYFQLFLPLLALFYGSSVLNDEIDNKTLIYLTTSPVSKVSILAGKFTAHYLISVVVISFGIFLAFIVSNFSHLLEVAYIKEFGIFVGVGLLAILAYSSLFTLLGTLMKKSILLGLFFIFGWESVVQFFPGTTQKLTISHYIKSLLPVDLSNVENPLAFHLQPSSTFEAIATLLILAAAFLALSIFVFYKKEFVLSEQE